MSDISEFIRQYMDENSPPYILKLSDEFNVDDVYLYSWHPIPTSSIMMMGVKRESDELKTWNCSNNSWADPLPT